MSRLVISEHRYSGYRQLTTPDNDDTDTLLQAIHNAIEIVVPYIDKTGKQQYMVFSKWDGNVVSIEEYYKTMMILYQNMLLLGCEVLTTALKYEIIAQCEPEV